MIGDVDPAKRRKGVARRLVAQLNSVAGDELAFTLEVWVSNRDAIAMYEKLGFRSAGVRPRYYQDNGEDALIMLLDLTGRDPRDRDLLRRHLRGCCRRAEEPLQRGLLAGRESRPLRRDRV